VISASGQGRPCGPGDRRVRSYPNSGCARIRAATPASGQERTRALQQTPSLFNQFVGAGVALRLLRRNEREILPRADACWQATERRNSSTDDQSHRGAGERFQYRPFLS